MNQLQLNNEILGTSQRGPPIKLNCCSSRNASQIDLELHRKNLQEKRLQLKNLKLKIAQLTAINTRLQKELKKLKVVNLKRKRATLLILRYLDHNFMFKKRSLQYIRRKTRILYKSQPYRYLLSQGFGLPATERVLYKRIMKIFNTV